MSVPEHRSNKQITAASAPWRRFSIGWVDPGPPRVERSRASACAILAGVDLNDCDPARRFGHQFKGSGEGYGFPEIARTGAALEAAAIGADEVEIRSQLLALTRYLDRIEIAV
jgi:hypothetical protein